MRSGHSRGPPIDRVAVFVALRDTRQHRPATPRTLQLGDGITYRRVDRVQLALNLSDGEGDVDQPMAVATPGRQYGALAMVVAHASVDSGQRAARAG